MPARPAARPAARLFARTALAALLASALLPLPVAAASQAFSQSLAAAASADQAIADWYRATNYASLWTGPEDAARRAALLAALDTAPDHGLPPARYDAAGLRAAFAAAETEGDVGRLEVAMTRAYLTWARDLTSGMLNPRDVDPTIVREVAVQDPRALLLKIAGGDAADVLQDLQPTSRVYAQFLRARFDLQAVIAAGGWGPAVYAGTLKPGDSGDAVVALRDRLVAMGYLTRSATRDYDASLQAAVTDFQLAHGLPADGVAGEATIDEINRPPEDRLKAVTVALERERWLDIDRSGRYVWVNLPDFTAKVIDQGRTVFRTRAVVGREDPDRRTPEFSDVMEHMVINPSWSVPRSITVKEYLPLMQRNPGAAGQLQVIDGNGRVVPRGAVNFAAYTAATFPFALRQPPGDGNALGKVKFMFPNPNNIYLHDTPAKELFAQDIRAYSHGCIRLADPFDFAYYLLSDQSETPEEDFAQVLNSGNETTVKLDRPLPVHLVYFTAYPESKGRMGYRRDVYGRDALIWDALAGAGVELAGVSQ